MGERETDMAMTAATAGRRRRAWQHGLAALALLGLLVAAAGCSIKKMATRSVAETFTEGIDVFTSDEDPELVGQAIPFGLKTMEMLLETLPEDRSLLLASCQGFTRYAFAFIQLEAELEAEKRGRRYLRAQQARALKMFIRARDYGIRGLELRNEGIGEALRRDPQEAVKRIEERDIDLLFWSAAAWGAAVSAGRDQPELLADFGTVRAMMGRALEIDEAYDRGSIHEVMIILESVTGSMGGSFERARHHFARAVELSEGKRPGPYVYLAESVVIAEQQRDEFVDLLKTALAIDPDEELDVRLSSILLQRKARYLLDHIDDYFLVDEADVDVEGE